MFYQFNHLGSSDYFKIEKGENFSFPPHLHQCFELIILLSGEMHINVDKSSFLLKKGEALLIFPNQIHSLLSNNSEHMLCIFSPKLIQAYSTRLTGKIPKNNKFSPDEYLINALDLLSSHSKTSAKKGVLYLFCSQFDEHAEYLSKQSDNENLLYRIFSFVESNYKGSCTLEALSKETGYDYSYLSRYFKKIIGMSFNSYVNSYRLSNACYLMENTDMPVIECAYDSGYTSLRSFNRNFQTHFHTTPTEYRRNIKEK